MTEISRFILHNNNMAYLTVGFTGLCVLIFCLGYFTRYRCAKLNHVRWKGLRFSIKKIAYIGMMVAVSVAITVSISIVIPITVFPPIRVAFSGIMIKISGLFFGPIVGLFVGILTELLCILFVPSYIHIAYFCVAASFGFWAGICSFTRQFQGSRNIITLILITLYFVVFTLVLFSIEYSNPNKNNANFLGIKISADFTPFFLLIMMGITLTLIWLVTIGLYFSRYHNWLNIVLPIVLLCIVTETLATILIAAWGDSQILGLRQQASGYSSMVLLRLFQTPFKIIFNTAVLSIVYKVMSPILRKAR